MLRWQILTKSGESAPNSLWHIKIRVNHPGSLTCQEKLCNLMILNNRCRGVGCCIALLAKLVPNLHCSPVPRSRPPRPPCAASGAACGGRNRRRRTSGSKEPSRQSSTSATRPNLVRLRQRPAIGDSTPPTRRSASPSLALILMQHHPRIAVVSWHRWIFFKLGADNTLMIIGRRIQQDGPALLSPTTCWAQACFDFVRRQRPQAVGQTINQLLQRD